MSYIPFPKMIYNMKGEHTIVQNAKQLQLFDKSEWKESPPSQEEMQAWEEAQKRKVFFDPEKIKENEELIKRNQEKKE